MTNEDIKNLHDTIMQSKTIAIIGHQQPDGDAICSAMALKNIIRNNCYTKLNGQWKKKKVDIFFDCEKIPESLTVFTKTSEDNINLDKTPLKYDLAISVDCNNPSRLGIHETVFNNAKYTINFDHHQDNIKFAELNFVYEDISSTCELLYRVYNSKLKKIYPYEISEFALSNIYAGILTDTNNLQNNANNGSTLKVVSDILSKIGIKKASKIKAYLFQNLSKAKMLLNSYSHDKRFRKYYIDESICIIMLNSKVFEKANAELEDAEGIADAALNMQSVKICALILEKKKGEFFVKLRGKDLDVSKIAQKFKGGGHVNMAGFSFKGNFNTIKYDLLKECEVLLKNNSQNQDQELDFLDENQ